MENNGNYTYGFKSIPFIVGGVVIASRGLVYTGRNIPYAGLVSGWELDTPTCESL